MSQMDRDHSRLVVIEKNKINSFKQEKFSSVKSEDGLFLYISLRLIQNYSSLVYSDFFPRFSDDVHHNGVLFLYISFLSFISAPHVQIGLLIFSILVLSAPSWQQLSSQIFSNSLWSHPFLVFILLRTMVCCPVLDGWSDL